MTGRTGNIILIGMIVGAILGVLAGFFLGDFMLNLKFLGTIFLNALKMVVIPLVVASMIVGVTSLGDIRTLGRTGLKTIGFYVFTTSASVFIGLVLVNIIQPGSRVELWVSEVPEFVAEGQGQTLIDVLTGLVPSNVFQAAASGDILPLIVFSLLFGGVLSAIGDKGKPVIAVFEGINHAMMKIVHLIILFAPVGVFALIGGIVAEERESFDQLATGLGMYALTVILGLL
ncbi:cation:dicarboxylase symporter family transporter, partial [candidate division GN15 bacterium]|nr:cation:dicarboxylase symporter family transporter [candidate division GN15 bacterium]